MKRIKMGKRQAQRSVFPWCEKPVGELDPEFREHPQLSPGAVMSWSALSRIRRRELLAGRSKETIAMELLHPRCAGLDVHKDSVVACLRIQQGAEAEHAVRTFGTTTRALLD